MSPAPEIRAGAARGGLVHVCLWTSGPDPAQDGLLRLRARRTEDGESLDLLCRPFASSPAEWGLDETLRRDFGLDTSELEDGLDAPRAWDELARFCAGSALLVADLERFEGWREPHAARTPGLVDALGLCELAALFLPGRWSARRDDLVAQLADGPPAPAPRAHSPEQLARAVHELLSRVRSQPAEVLVLAQEGYARAAAGLAESEPVLARRLRLALELLSASGGGEPGARAPVAAPALEELVDGLEPRWARERVRWESLSPLPPTRDGLLPFADEDQERLERVFRERLPGRFARDGGGAASYRAGQHEVAREIARTLGGEELLLVHAPTGTGKTLAYLVPLLLWARRHEVRAGVATFTRALQEQAYDRELPRALAALAEEGIPGGLRVSVLKGRENYLCWRALRLALPADEQDGATWLAWTQLALFAATDLGGELDRLPLRAPLPAESTAALLGAANELRRSVRAQAACCTQREERATCAAEQARMRAERSHVVIVNQAFALAVPEFLRHVVFDECEHLHEQAHSAWSRLLPLRSAHNFLGRLAQAARPGARGLLDRLQRQLLEETPSRRSLAEARRAAGSALAALEQLEAGARAFLEWREEEERHEHAADSDPGLGTFLEREESAALVAARVEFGLRLSALDAALAELAARLAALPSRALAQARRQLDLARLELAALFEALGAWMPMDEERPSLRPRTFYDVERDARGDLVLASRVLLPNEFLGRGYYPQLRNAAFVSATTWIGEGFDAALGYLGLDRAAQPAPEEERPPARVRTFRAPDPFDYGRVLVAVPRDAPSAGQQDKPAFLEYVRRFVGHLAERTRGRMLVLFTNAQDARQVGQELGGFFRARRIPLWFQNQEGTVKEELSELFRARVDSVLLGVDTFWFGADFPGETLEYLVIVKLPYGVPDRYHRAQCAALGRGEQRKRIYLPRALAKFRQGFGRLMRRESDRGCVFVLDARVLEPRHRMFLRELPLEDPLETLRDPARGVRRARLVRGDTERCLREALAHMDLADDVRRRGLGWDFSADAPGRAAGDESAS